MTDKELVLDAIDRLSPDATLAEIRERIEFLAALQEAEDAVERGDVVPHDEVEKEFASWVKSWHTRSSGRGLPSET